MIKAFKYRLWTNANQERELDIALETHRRLYNKCLEQRKTSYETSKTSIRYGQQSAWFKDERKINEWFARLNFSSAQTTMRRLDRAYQAFFRRLKSGGKPGFPRFKKFGSLTSIAFPSHGDGIRLKGDRLRIQHIGLVRVKLHRPCDGEIKQLTLVKEADKWYVVVVCEIQDEIPSTTNVSETGIDVGVESFLTEADGRTVDNPKILRSRLKVLRKAQRSVSRKKKGGANRRKAQKKVRKVHAKVKNQRSDFHWKTANDLVRRYGKIAVESLNVQRMMGNRRLARSIADAGWAAFLSRLKSKAESAGVLVVEVDCRGTSQVCSGCGETVPKTLKDRWHDCTCGLSISRDHNSALEILRRGRLAWAGPAGVNVSR